MGCNLAFDLSRLAVRYRIARPSNTGWSLVLFEYYNSKKRKWLPNSYRPRVRINPKDSRDAFMSLASGDRTQGFRRGRFLNLLTMAWALRNRRYGLQSACVEWGVEGKQDHEPTGKVKRAEIDYCRQDVRATHNLLNAIKVEYQRYPIELRPEKVHSPASLAKAYLKSMRVIRPATKYRLPNKILGIAMQGYYGGRAEVRIRQVTVPVVYCDFTSEYPTVNSLMHIWPMLVAARLRVRDETTDVRKLIQDLTLEDLLRRDFWPQLSFFALIEPSGDIVPVRTCYSDTGETNIGLNPLNSKEPIWYAGPDIAASRLLTGRSPKILKAIRLAPTGMQKGLTSTMLGDRTIDPSCDDLFCAVIENRKQLPPEHSMYHFLKILANAGGYGMYAELNRERFGKNNQQRIEVYSGEKQFEQTVSTVENPGPWYFPPIASLVTAGGRLLLAMLERMVSDAGGTYMMCDTDSMAIVSTERGGLVSCPGGLHKDSSGVESIKALPWTEVAKIAATFHRLNPYDQTIVREILRVEDYNFDRNGKQRQLYGLAISAKRYVLFTQRGDIIKPSEHGLGPYFHPNKRRYIPRDCQNQKDSYPRWMVEGWRWILRNHQGKRPQAPSWFKLLAMRRIAITSPNVLTRLRRIDRESAKPYNFVISPMQTFEGPTLIAPFCDDPSRWAGLKIGLDYISVEDGTRYRLCNPDDDELLIWTPEYANVQLSKTQIKYLLSSQLRDLAQVFSEYTEHPEAKSLAPDGFPCKSTTRGLLQRRPISATSFAYIGKEVDRHTQDDLNILSDVRPIEYRPEENMASNRRNVFQEETRRIARILKQRIGDLSIREIARTTGLDRNTIRRARHGRRLHWRTHLKLMRLASES